MSDQEITLSPPMSVDTSTFALLADLQYLEPFASEALNRKFYGVIPPGIYRGFQYVLPGSMKLRIGRPSEAGTAIIHVGDRCITVQQYKPVDLVVAAGFVGRVVLEGFYQFGVKTKQVDSESTVDAVSIKLVTEAQYKPEHVTLYNLNVPANATAMQDSYISDAKRDDVDIAVDSSIYRDLAAHIASPTAHTKAQVGLSNVNNWPATAAVNDSSDVKYATAGAVKRSYDLAAAALPKSGGVVDGKIVVGPTGFDSYGWPNATDRDQNNYISRSRLMVRAGNNGLSMFGTAAENARRFGLQVGHSDGTYASAVGTLELNPYGGQVLINGGRAYHTGYKPTSTDVGLGSVNNWPATASVNDSSDAKYATAGAVKRAYDLAAAALPKTGGIISSALTVNGLLNAVGGFQVGGVDVIGTSTTVARIGDGSFERELNLNAKNALAYVQYGSGRHRIYHEGYKPSPAALGTYTQSEIDNKVNDSGFKTVTVAAPAGVVAGKFYPILVTSSIEGRQELYVSTRSSGGSDPMNNCSFHGIVRAAGWSDKTNYVDGQFTIYTDSNERAIHSIAMPTESEGSYAIYVEARAFPVQLRLPIRCGVSCTGQDMQAGTTTFSAGVSEPGGTKVQIKADFSKGSGRYFNSNKAYHEGFRPSANDINALDIRGTNTMTGNLNIQRPSNDAGLMVKGGDGKNAWLKLLEGSSFEGTDFGMYMHYNGATDNVGRIGMINNNVWVDSIRLSRDTGAIELEKGVTAKSTITALSSIAVQNAAGVKNHILESADTVATYRFDNAGGWRLWAGGAGGVQDVITASQSGNVNIPNGNLSERGQRVYSPNNKPTPSAIGAVSKTGDTMTGPLIAKSGAEGIVIQDDIGRLRGKKLDGTASWYVGKGSASALDLYSNELGVGLKITGGADGIFYNNKKLYHEGNKPTAADVLAIPVKKPHLADWTSAPEMAGKRYVGGYQSPDEVASYMSFGAGSGQRMDIFLDGEMYVDEGRQKVYHPGNKPTAADVGATSREVYVGEGFRNLGSLQSQVGSEYFYRWYKLCEHTTSALVDTTFDIIVSADKNYAGSSGRYYVTVSRYEGASDPVGSLHVSVNRKYGAPDMIELAVKKETGKTTVWVRGKRMWGNIGVSVINRGTDGGKPTFVADGTFVLSNDAILANTVKMNCGNIFDGDTGAISYAFNDYFNKVHDSGARVFSPNNKPRLADITDGTLTGNMKVTGWIESAGTFKSTANNALAIVAEKGGHQAAIGCSQTVGEYIFGGKTTAASDYQHYIRLGNNKFQYHQNGSNFDVYHSGNKPTATDVNAVGRSSVGSGSVNLNALRTAQHLRLEAAGNITNRPSDDVSYAQMIHVNGGGDTHMQILGTYNTGKLFWRGFNNTQAAGSVSWHQIYHTGFKPTAADVNAVALNGSSTMAGTLVVDYAGYGVHIKRDTYPGIMLESKGLTSHRQKLIEVNNGGHLTFITRNDRAENNGVVVLEGGKSGTLYHTGNKPTPEEIGTFKASWGSVTNQDWNTLTVAGSYSVDNASGANKPAIIGHPDVYTYGTLFVQNNGRTISQMYITDGNKIYLRDKYGSNAWGTWSGVSNDESTGITTSVDLDDLSCGGPFNMYKGSGVTFTNAPSDFDFGTLQVIGRGRAGGSFVTQILTWRSNGRQMIRTRNDGTMTWTPWRKIYSESQKPTAADVGAVSKSGDEMTARLKISGTADNTVPTVDQVKLDGYGVIGNRGTVYVTNGSTASNAAVALGIGGAHAADIKLLIEKLKVTSNVDLYERGNRVYSPANKPTSADVGLGSVNNWPATASVNDASDAKYATAGAVKRAYDLASAALPKSGGDLSGNLRVKHSDTVEHSLGTQRQGRNFYMFDNGNQVGLYANNLKSGQASATLIHRDIATGDIGVGEPAAVLSTYGKNAAPTYNKQSIYHTGFKPSAADIGAATPAQVDSADNNVKSWVDQNYSNKGHIHTAQAGNWDVCNGTWNAIGSYSFAQLYPANDYGQVAPGSTVPGAHLRACSVDNDGDDIWAAPLAGTYMCMGMARGNAGGEGDWTGHKTLWVRIA
ncbi:pyocin knob domain-containing protein [Aeromonas sp. Y318-3]|uniref:pyocin knob domain-containing protein n=1 Tax=Aeromonas sp. Y318-3 TaxID=2990509 RepID=UPI0022E1F242|nr:pyocin knob domain-containing protein [Aeromonas sp. Y318-3]